MAVSFESDIRPLFTETDVDHMEPFGVMLSDYAYMSQKANAEAVRDYITGAKQPQMPPGGPYWNAEHVALLTSWIAAGCPA